MAQGLSDKAASSAYALPLMPWHSPTPLTSSPRSHTTSQEVLQPSSQGGCRVNLQACVLVIVL
jgi:hypothetical protein